ncbi:hypothetical protein INS49_012309 [Diaporthe citri]|uniref:uncharacterized protein n=1 Tax=Diaporthe citri TaxID=83186 RepID=UPI001C7E69B7|nr:uncharacterized protein INS49_012309 [Diaporthe citri]KAG6358790.1 hypothetical protein INS49_012309 [Diaporthe citri]
MVPRFVLDVYYNFSLKELGIHFHTAQQAQKYQALNREGRILAGNEKMVWIPIPSGMTDIRGSSFGFVMCFESADAASTWCKRVVLGVPYDGRDHNTKEAYIVREWSEDDLEQKLAGRAGQLGLPGQMPEHRGPSPGREFRATGRVEGEKKKDPVGFGIERPRDSDTARYGIPSHINTKGK